MLQQLRDFPGFFPETQARSPPLLCKMTALFFAISRFFSLLMSVKQTNWGAPLCGAPQFVKKPRRVLLPQQQNRY